ncbi:hypothetical protein [aff. Roholtiella sp. LEGE 12411]|uniref:hypothetical protein n=1 Tax=aff. Roholtiella sp. LEGE 12411 TaxID=1828822 RepID=UPI00187EBE6D|nr:hypothetical protein [aff. Roholtiella sp. LEGE 12411]MBE9033633.1 hypothetical protein [aff. Roholtiella sp. LEGE 12411]
MNSRSKVKDNLDSGMRDYLNLGLTQLAHKASGIRVKGQGEPLRPCGSADLKQVAFKNQGFLDF